MSKSPRKPSGRPVTTRSGKVLKVNQSLGERYSAMRAAKSLRKVNRLRGLPKSRIKRIMWRLQPKRLAEYWFSRDGAIMALKVVGITILVLFILTLGVFAYFRKDLKGITDLSAGNLGGSISYYDRTGKNLLWQDYNINKRIPVQSQDIPAHMKEATVAIEDKNFYNEKGFDIKGIIRAAVVDTLHRNTEQGGSTITQQLVKLTQDFNQNRTFAIKLKELILAVEVERTYTKDQILTSYLNAAPYGGIDYGVQTAAGDYFHKNAKDLTLAECAFLAAIPKSPAYFSPYSPSFDQKAFISRYDYVLDQMADQHKISQADANKAKKVDVIAEVQPQQTRYAGIRAPYFVMAAKDELNKRFASQTSEVGGWKVITTLDMNLQNKAEQTVQNNAANVKRYGGDDEALVLEDVKTGQMLASVGGTDFNNPDYGQLNYAHSVNISPGSSFKPYDYTTLIDNNTSVGAGSVLYDSQSPLPGYSCTDKSLPPPKGHGNCLEDYDFRYPGPETLRYALGGSRNVPAVKAMLEASPGDNSSSHTTSINKVISTANQLMAAPDAYRCFKQGVDVSQAKTSDESQCYSSSAIGDGAYLHLDEHVNGLASLARLGNAFANTYILNIQNAAGKTIYKFNQPKGTQVVRQQSAYIVDNMLSDPNASYLVGSEKWQHYKGWDTAVKTGTTNDSFDGLMMGWNTQYAVGSWVGYHTRNQALTTFMENLTLPLSKVMMEYALDNSGKTPANWAEPSGIQHLPAYVMHSKISSNGEVVPSPATDIYPSWYKPKAASSQSVTLDKVSGKIATSCTPASAKETLGGNAAPNSFSIDEFYPPGQTSSPSSSAPVSGNGGVTDDVHQCSDSPPTITLTATGPASDGSYTVNAFVSAGTHPFNDPKYPQYPGTVTFSLNGNVIKTQSVSDPSDNVGFSFTPDASGTLTATVTDSVLYSASDSATVNFTPGGGPLTLQATATGTNVDFSWSGGTAPFTVYKSNGTTPVGGNCSATSGNSCTAPKSGNSYTIKDSNGQTATASL
ncbi:MAG TPA: transglycosylase domain-containing protein [Candidatus Saccharimonadales bacterium]|nr:transglycosylase domain-containing protein [Candidatus Saccharimonadales bacterium]